MRPLQARIHVGHLLDNYRYLKQRHGKDVFAVVKADAYGHGAVFCAQALAKEVDGFAVAFLEEAIELRAAGIQNKILLLEGVFSAQDYAAVEQWQLIPVIQNEVQWHWFTEYSWQKPTTIWIKLDTGMRRAGLDTIAFKQIVQAAKDNKAVAFIVAMTHFACADDPSHILNDQQWQHFCAETVGLFPVKSACNSSAVLYHPQYKDDIARVGLAIYGIHPSSTVHQNVQLKPVMSLYSQVFSVKHLRQGETIGYGAVFTAPRDMRVGLVACGYADGYPWSSNPGMPVMIDGHLSRLVGRVSMDMLSVELTQCDQGVGSQVELWGEHVCVNEVANQTNTTAYAILCHLKRAQKIYIGQNELEIK